MVYSYKFNVIGEDRMILTELGTKIKCYRKKLNLSQEKFSLSINMDRTYLASVEAGKRNISILNLQKIANGLGISLSELLEGIGCFDS